MFLFFVFIYSGSFSQIGFQIVVRNVNPVSAFTVNFSAISQTKPVSDTAKKHDQDGDGIADSLDKCPNEKGVIEYDGCPVPDSDNDGVADDIDDCPTVAGLAKYKGCPPRDRDGDKINDDDDKCPNVPGVARYEGCPVGDKDGDGVNDDDDKCIDVPGDATNAGCPETKKTSRKPDKNTIKKKRRFVQVPVPNNLNG